MELAKKLKFGTKEYILGEQHGNLILFKTDNKTNISFPAYYFTNNEIHNNLLETEIDFYIDNKLYTWKFTNLQYIIEEEIFKKREKEKFEKNTESKNNSKPLSDEEIKLHFFYLLLTSCNGNYELKEEYAIIDEYKNFKYKYYYIIVIKIL